MYPTSSESPASPKTYPLAPVGVPIVHHVVRCELRALPESLHHVLEVTLERLDTHKDRPSKRVQTARENDQNDHITSTTRTQRHHITHPYGTVVIPILSSVLGYEAGWGRTKPAALFMPMGAPRAFADVPTLSIL